MLILMVVNLSEVPTDRSCVFYILHASLREMVCLKTNSKSYSEQSLLSFLQVVDVGIMLTDEEMFTTPLKACTNF